MSQAQFAESIHIPTNTYSNYEKRVREPDSDFWIAVAEKYNVSIDYLMGFTDDPKRSKYATPSKLDQKYAALDDYGRRIVDLVIDAETDRVKAQAAQAETPVIDLGTIRHYLYSPAAGPDGLAEDEFEDIPRTEDMPRGADFCVTLSGDSMEPYLHDGQMIFVARDRQVNRLDVGVWYYQGGTYVKQLDKRDDAIYLLSANPSREAANLRIPYESEHDLRCYGKVLGIKKLPLPEYR
jgi:transcriptional regulator with XRE-family HTH domain